jgi:hypothetical protein
VRHYSRSPGRGCLNIELDRSARRIELRSERLEIELDPETLELSIAARGAAPRLSGVRPRAWVAGRALTARRAQSFESERVDTALGPATRLLVCCELAPGMQLGLSLDLGGDWPGVVLQVALQNSGGSALQLDALDTLHWHDARGELELPGAAGALRWLDPGAHGGLAPRSTSLRRRLRAQCAASLAAPGSAGLTLGFLGWRVHCGWLQLDARAGQPVELVVRSELRTALAASEGTLGERVWVGIDAPDADGLAGWAERTGLELEVASRRPLSVWCTGPGADARSTLELARALRERELPVDAIRLDPGFALRPGDWLLPGAAFPGGLEPLVRSLEPLGFALGVRLAPLAVAARSEPARAHPAWLLRGPARIAAGRVRVLDPAQEPVLGWLEQLARGLVGRGAAHLWLDELWLGLLPDGAAQRAQSYRRALESVRRGAGPEATLTGLRAPFAASAGLLDALQLFPELPARARWLRARRRSADLALRAGLAQRLGHAEGPTVWLDAEDAEALRAAAIQSAICGGNVCLGGSPRRISEPGWRLARRLLPPSGARPRRLPRVAGALAAPGADGSELIALLDAALPLDPSALAAGEVHVFDAWHGLDLGRSSAGPAAGALDSSASQLLRLSPVDGRARLIGSSLHLGAGAAELRRIESDPGHGVRVALALPGPRQGSIYIQPPGNPSKPLRLRIAFDGEVELLAAAVHSE